VLVFQDVWAVAMLAAQPNLGHPDLTPLIASVLKGALLIIWSLAASRYVLPHLFRSVAKVPELVVISALAWCFFLAAAASVAGLSREMGALIAGVSLSTFPYNLDVIAKVTSIRDFFVTLFFVGLGMEIPLPSLHAVMVALAAAVFVFASRLVVVPILYSLRMGHRASILPAINLAQVSEFSIVIASLGLARGHIPTEVVTIIVLVFAVTSVGSTYLIGSSHAVYDALSVVLRHVGIRDLDHEHGADRTGGHGKSIVFLGFFREASSVFEELEQRDSHRHRRLLDQLLVIDFNPQVISELERRGVMCIYGDVAHVDTLRHAHVEDAKLIISTIPDDVLRGTTNLRLLHNAREVCPQGSVILATAHIDQALKLYLAGADWVFITRLHGANDLADAIVHGRAHGFAKLRADAIADLRQRDEVLA
jgi:voltage-gated potassium channel Kch